MKDKILNGIGIGLLTLCFVVSLVRIALNSHQAAGPTGEGITLRICHWQLEGGVREAIDKIADEYMRTHPGIKIIQIPIPERIYFNWLTTQLVGGTAPDLLQLEPSNGANTEKLAKYFRPLTEFANSDNPYNKGTELEGMKVRDTLFDGMEGGFNPTLLEYYGLPISGGAIRVFYNLDLLKQVSGSETLPQSFGQMVDLCRQTQAHHWRADQTIIPIVGSKYNSPILMKALFGSQTQKLLAKLNPPGVFEVTAYPLEDKFWKGEWSLRNEEIVSGLKLMRELGQFMQPGFMQVQRDDALFYFLQGNALMLTTGSWDAASINGQADFRVGAAAIPFPAMDDPAYGRYTTGAPSEAGKNAGLVITVTRFSQHPEAAQDFLYFLASKRINQLWTDTSGWVPAVIHVKPAPQALPFQPVLTGSTGGFDLSFAGPDTSRIHDNALNLLFSPNGSPQKYLDAIAGKYSGTLASDARRSLLGQRDNVRRSDPLLGALAWKNLSQPDDAAVQAKLDKYLQAISATERGLHGTRDALENAGKLNP